MKEIGVKLSVKRRYLKRVDGELTYKALAELGGERVYLEYSKRKAARTYMRMYRA